MATTRVAIAPMKAAQVRKPGGDFEIVEREVPQPGAGNVRIKVQACGVCHSDIFQICAVAEIPPAARQALSVLTAMPAHSHALALLPFGYTGAQLVDHPHDFVSRNTGVLNPRPSSFFDEHVAVTDAAGLRRLSQRHVRQRRSLAGDSVPPCSGTRSRGGDRRAGRRCNRMEEGPARGSGLAWRSGRKVPGVPPGGFPQLRKSEKCRCDRPRRPAL